MEDFLRYAVDHALSLGATYAEARYHSIEEFSLTTRNGLVISSGRSISRGIGVRVLVKGSLGFASTNTLDRESIRRAVEKAYANARSLSELVKVPLTLAPERVGVARYEVIQKKPLKNVSLEDKLALHKDIARNVSSVVKESKVTSLLVVYGESIEEKMILNSDGAFIHSIIPRPYLFVNLSLAHPQKGSIQKMESFGGSGGYDILEAHRIVEEITELAGKMEKILLTGREPPKEPVDLVLGSEITGLAMHESVGHPLEADRVLGREAAQAGESYLKPDMIGERIGNKHGTVIDDPTIPGSYGFYLYDDEGVPARPKYLYKEGVVNELLHNRFTASIFRVRSNASARSMDHMSEPIVRMSNTYLEPGDMRFEELIEDIKYGIYIKSYMEWNIDDSRWGQRYGGLEAYEIVNGELRDFIRNPVVEFTTKTFFSSIVGKSRDLRFYAATCGKGEPSQGVPVWVGGPDVRLSKMRVGVIS
ncbi:MAG: TldD/PmbA family protein [Sulfolobales archaeon]